MAKVANYIWIVGGIGTVVIAGLLAGNALVTRQTKPNSVETAPALTSKPNPQTQSHIQKADEKMTDTVATTTPSHTQFDALMGGTIDLADFEGKVVLVVNTASKCGYTSQYKGLEALYRARQDEGLVIVGVPSGEFGGQEYGSAEEIAEFCELNFGVSFPMAAKTSVRGATAHPFYRNALVQLGTSAQPAWNFHKILVGKDGNPIGAFPSNVAPDAPELTRAIDVALAGTSAEPAARS